MKKDCQHRDKFSESRKVDFHITNIFHLNFRSGWFSRCSRLFGLQIQRRASRWNVDISVSHANPCASARNRRKLSDVGSGCTDVQQVDSSRWQRRVKDEAKQ